MSTASLAAVALVGLVGCSPPQLPECSRACVYEPVDPVVVRVGASEFTVVSSDAEDQTFMIPSPAAGALRRRLMAWQSRHKQPAPTVLHVECAESVSARRVDGLLSSTDTWPVTGKEVRTPTAVALRGRGGGFVAVGFGVAAVQDARELTLMEGSCGDLVRALDEAAASGGTAVLRR